MTQELNQYFIFFNFGGAVTVIARWRGDVTVLWQAVALISLFLALLGSIAFQILNVYRSISSVSQPVSSFLNGQAERAQKDFILFQKIGTASASSLEFAAARLRSEAEHLQGRIGMVAGAVDKVGIIPLAAGWLFSGWQLLENARAKSTAYIDITVAGLGVLYCLSLMMLATSYRVDELAKIAELACEHKSHFRH